VSHSISVGESLESGTRSFAGRSELSCQRGRKGKELRPYDFFFFFARIDA
jgi:hypothetical protein